MSEDEEALLKIIFVTVLGIQYHPRNVVADDFAVIRRSLAVAKLALTIYKNEV